jgi:hypothetical protein
MREFWMPDLNQLTAHIRGNRRDRFPSFLPAGWGQLQHGKPVGFLMFRSAPISMWRRNVNLRSLCLHSINRDWAGTTQSGDWRMCRRDGSASKSDVRARIQVCGRAAKLLGSPEAESDGPLLVMAEI